MVTVLDLHVSSQSARSETPRQRGSSAALASAVCFGENSLLLRFAVISTNPHIHHMSRIRGRICNLYRFMRYTPFLVGDVLDAYQPSSFVIADEKETPYSLLP